MPARAFGDRAQLHVAHLANRPMHLAAEVGQHEAELTGVGQPVVGHRFGLMQHMLDGLARVIDVPARLPLLQADAETEHHRGGQRHQAPRAPFAVMDIQQYTVGQAIRHRHGEHLLDLRLAGVDPAGESAALRTVVHMKACGARQPAWVGQLFTAKVQAGVGDVITHCEPRLRGRSASPISPLSA